MINNKLMLVYGLKEAELNLLKDMCANNNLSNYKIVNKSMCKMKLRDIIKGMNLEVEDVDMPEEKVVIFNNFSDNELELGVKKNKRNFEASPYNGSSNRNFYRLGIQIFSRSFNGRKRMV